MDFRSTELAEGRANRLKKLLTESKIRSTLLHCLRDMPELGIIAEEVRIEGGSARIDVVGFGVEITGYEIKSDFDNFDRMANQIHAYNRTFPKINLVCGARHLDYAIAMLPSWWGIIQGTLNSDDQLYFQRIRESTNHELQDPYSVASLLPKQAAIQILTTCGCAVHPRLSLREIWSKVAENVPLRNIEKAIVHNISGSNSLSSMPLFDVF